MQRRKSSRTRKRWKRELTTASDCQPCSRASRATAWASPRVEYGYYVLPVLAGDRLVGRIDPLLDRRERVLRVNGVWWEPGCEPVDLGPALAGLARFVAADAVEV